MTEEFREFADELAQGLNFPENGVVFCTAVNSEDEQGYDLSCHIDGNLGTVSNIVEFIVKHYLKPLDDETAEIYGGRLINIIKNNGKGEQTNE